MNMGFSTCQADVLPLGLRALLAEKVAPFLIQGPFERGPREWTHSEGLPAQGEETGCPSASPPPMRTYLPKVNPK